MSKKSYKELIETERLVLLRSNNERDLSTLKYYLQVDGDFEIFCGLEKSEKNIELFNLEVPESDYYSIFCKKTLKMVGYIAISAVDEKTVEIEFYIFKMYRRKHYCKEACRRLIDYIYSFDSIIVISASVTNANKVAITFLKSMGFAEVPLIGWQLLQIESDDNLPVIPIKVFRLEKDNSGFDGILYI